jgi:hypothetical protein
MSEIASQNVLVPARAAEWIQKVLQNAGVPASGALQLAIEDRSDLDLRLLNGMYALGILLVHNECMLTSSIDDESCCHSRLFSVDHDILGSR